MHSTYRAPRRARVPSLIFCFAAPKLWKLYFSQQFSRILFLSHSDKSVPLPPHSCWALPPNMNTKWPLQLLLKVILQPISGRIATTHCTTHWSRDSSPKKQSNKYSWTSISQDLVKVIIKKYILKTQTRTYGHSHFIIRVTEAQLSIQKQIAFIPEISQSS